MFPATGSTITAAVFVACSAKYAAKASTELYGSTAVSDVNASGTPGDPGIPRVATPLPALARRWSAWPWYPPSNLTTRSRPVAARASRIADMAASVPEFTSRTCATPDTCATSSSASSVSASVGAPKLLPRPAWARMASTTEALACPRISGP